MSSTYSKGAPTIAYSGRMFQIVEQDHVFDGETKTFEIARRAPGTRLIVPSKDDERILLIKEFRFELDRQDVRLPGGKVFDTLGEYSASLGQGIDIEDSTEQAAHKELREETGLETEAMKFLAKSVCGATVEWDLYYFLVGAFTEIPSGQTLETGEHIERRWTPRAEVEAMCLDGRIGEERSALILLRYLKGSL